MQVERIVGIPALEPAFCLRAAWRTAAEGRKRFRDEHINLKELRVCYMTLRRLARSGRAVGRRVWLALRFVEARSCRPRSCHSHEVQGCRGRARGWRRRVCLD